MQDHIIVKLTFASSQNTQPYKATFVQSLLVKVGRKYRRVVLYRIKVDI